MPQLTSDSSFHDQDRWREQAQAVKRTEGTGVLKQPPIGGTSRQGVMVPNCGTWFTLDQSQHRSHVSSENSLPL